MSLNSSFASGWDMRITAPRALNEIAGSFDSQMRSLSNLL